jgi:hypothetical protein
MNRRRWPHLAFERFSHRSGQRVAAVAAPQHDEDRDALCALENEELIRGL